MKTTPRPRTARFFPFSTGSTGGLRRILRNVAAPICLLALVGCLHPSTGVLAAQQEVKWNLSPEAEHTYYYLLLSEAMFQNDERLAPLVTLFGRHGDEAGKIVSRNFNQGVLYQLALFFHLHGQIGILIFQEGDGITIFGEQNGADMTQHLVFEVFLDPGLMVCRDLVLIDQKDIVAGQREHQFPIGGIEGLAEQFYLILNGVQQILGFRVSPVFLVDQDATLDVRNPHLEEFILIIGEDP